jgi:hypothetical protein
MASTAPAGPIYKVIPTQTLLQGADPKQLRLLWTWLHGQALEMDRLQDSPEKIEQALARKAHSLNPAEAAFLALQAADDRRTHNERALAVDLLTRDPLKNASLLLNILARPDNSDSFAKLPHAQKDVMESFETTLSLQVLQHLENPALQNPHLLRDLEGVARLNLSRRTVSHIQSSLDAAKRGQAFWTLKKSAFLNGVSL